MCVAAAADMGALAPVTHWLPQDDLLLKNAVEAGASLESLAKGAVQLSRRFTVQELQDRWYALLYDPVVSVEASVRMIEYERSSSTAQAKLNKIDSNKGAKCILRKRKIESVRKCYYATRKRICNEPLDSMDLIFLDESGNGDSGNGHEPASMGCLLGDQVSKYLGCQELTFGVIDHPLVEYGVNGAASTGDGFSTATFCTGLNDHHSFSPGQRNQAQNICPLDEILSLTGSHTSINEFGPSKELETCNVLESVNLEVNPPCMVGQSIDEEGNVCSGSGCQVINSSAPGCHTYLQSSGYSSPIPQMPVLTVVDNVSASPLPDVCLDHNEPHAEDGLRILDDFDVHSRNRDGCGIIDEKSELEDQITCGSMKDLAINAEKYCSFQTSCGDMKDLAPNVEEYFEQLSNSLLNFSPEDELLFMDADGKDIIDKSYIDNLSSLLLDFPDESDMSALDPPEASVAPQECQNITTAAHHGELGDKEQYHCSEQRLVWSVEAQKLSSALTVNPAFPELRNGVICCMLNTEDTEIPDNDDVFLPIWMPSSSDSLMNDMRFDEAYYPVTSSVKEFSHGQKATDRVMMTGERIRSAQLLVPSPMTESRLSEMCPDRQPNDHDLKFELPCSDVEHLVLMKTGTREYPNHHNITHSSKKDTIHGSVSKSFLKVEEAEDINHESGDSHIQKNAVARKQEADGKPTIQIKDDMHAELCSMLKTVPEQAENGAASDQEDFSCESDGDVPYFSDVEAMILDMDLSPDDQDIYHSPGALRYQHEDTRRTIIRLEQAAAAYMQRSMWAEGAFAVLYGRRSKHFINKPEVLIGRGTEDVKVDIDLGREARANKISRRQATLMMGTDGSFNLRNHGKCPIFINGKEVLSGHKVSLISGCLIEVGKITFVFETNKSLCKAYLDTFEMKPDLGS